MKKETAQHILNQVNESLGILNALLFDIKNDLEESEYQPLKRSVARIMNLADIEITMNIVKTYPELSPWSDEKS